MFKFLKRFGKGFATVAGLGGVAAGGSLAISVDPSVNEALHQIGQIIAALGALIASFGIGRKAGVHNDS